MKNNWERKKIGEVCKLYQGLAVNVKTKHYLVEKSDLPLLRIKDLKNNTVEQYVDPNNYPKNCLVTEKDLIYTRTGQIGLVFTGRFGILHNNSFKVEPDKSLLKEYLFLFLQSERFKNKILKLASRTAQPDITHKIFKEQIIFVPPLCEQKRIVTILDEVFEGIDRAIANTEKNLANSCELFKSYLNAIFTQKGDGWISTTVGNLVEQRILDKPLDGNHGEIHPKKSDFVKSGVPFIMASDLLDGVVDQVNCNFITLEQAKSLRKGFAKDGDVLLSHKGTIGRVAILKTSHPSVVLTPQVTYYRVRDESVIYNRYLYYFFHCPYFQKEIKTIAGAGSTRAYIGITSQLQLEISYPRINDQKRYADSFDALISETQRLETIYRQKIAALKELKQSILQKAFTGELTADTPKTVKEELAA